MNPFVEVSLAPYENKSDGHSGSANVSAIASRSHAVVMSADVAVVLHDGGPLPHVVKFAIQQQRSVIVLLTGEDAPAQYYQLQAHSAAPLAITAEQVAKFIITARTNIPRVTHAQPVLLEHVHTHAHVLTPSEVSDHDDFEIISAGDANCPI